MDFAVDLPSLSKFGFWSSMQSGGIKLPLDSHPSLHNSNIKGTKRKWNDNTGVEGSENPLLALGLGQSPSSSVVSKMSSAGLSTTSSVKETDEESPANPEFSFKLHIGNGYKLSYNKSSVGTLKAPHTVDMLNLQLSLSTGSSESALIDVNTIAGQHLYSFESSVIASPVQISEEEGSASSCWIFGKCLVQPCVPNPETGSSNFPPQKRMHTEADPIAVLPDFPSTMTQMSKNPVACSSGISDSHKRNNRTKYCQFHGCTKGARGASSLCIAHGGGRRCQRPECQKGAEGRTIYCKAHGGGRRCQHLGCTKSAEGRTDYCIAHGGGRRCSHLSCTRAARGKSGLCIRHGGGKRCQIKNCTKSAEGSSGLCISHGGGRRCHFHGCTKGAQGSTLFCKAHGGGKRCTVVRCTKGAEGSTPFCKGHGGGKRCSFQGGGVCPKSVHGGTSFCVAHGGGKRCAVAGCPKSARGRTSFCVRHGGGKRCKFEGCGKSAQGSTDFCKVHGGGKRCTWSQLGSKFDVGETLCDKYARGKTGLCAAHSALVQDHCVHGGGMLGPPTTQYPVPVKLEKMNDVAAEEETFTKLELKKVVHSALQQSGSSGPEVWVRGGGLVGMIASSSGFWD
ncbi:unnamed protein product [Musa acuminata subsp. malaccensis]|uniref:(wild Malaysian banana) hypothetical protein n=1 Tax=Musa acuminata subsp. malaccensis TaxID=214687 RepID=A0A804JJ72_MUSAM|nr:PREDICTED: uncharacterized protein LOC103988833 [Musa acuminata subsp. malaccensis]XP_009405757.1 PREDICTED: uncharacterized protein LOC103988833 [Musa acuminata subsp. malaccensis]XP_009405758.1 PREDICTED: uncharacterized protein LOC103988833 [Musa acuminata subsp. malaccensis]XP_018683326.1 PREDICTED: uncharacterized protein LOC103988833 [Musa acuminata subsp. malaccensis]XP_018683327.1 PREDICTED: uncharacterized protein LOC103988833 [Musa acuminata subsp. malaccensis]CAG1847173.1 unnamed